MKTIEFNLIPFEGVAPNKSLAASGGRVNSLPISNCRLPI
jgi:hypothetical protein